MNQGNGIKYASHCMFDHHVLTLKIMPVSLKYGYDEAVQIIF